jgi:hypothetical protein
VKVLRIFRPQGARFGRIAASLYILTARQLFVRHFQMNTPYSLGHLQLFLWCALLIPNDLSDFAQVVTINEKTVNLVLECAARTRLLRLPHDWDAASRHRLSNKQGRVAPQRGVKEQVAGGHQGSDISH